MLLKEVFDKSANGTLTLAEFEKIVGEASAKFVDLSTGDYVSVSKHNDEINHLNNQIKSLNSTISARDTDLQKLNEQLQQAGNDSADLEAARNSLSQLQAKYDTETKDYQKQLKRQAYEFAVRDYANSKKFTSQAAKRDFITSMIAQDLKMDKDKILGADDFATSYATDNADAFVTEEQKPPVEPKPTFVSPTPGAQPAPTETNEFVNAFHFMGVRPTPKETN